MHPSFNTNVSVTGTLVALSPRLFISQSTTTGRCVFAVWVGTTAGGDFSGIEVIDSFLPPGGATGDCFMAPPNVLPDTVAIGSAVTVLSGIYDEFCPTGSTCPASTAEQIEVTSGTFTISGMAAVPSPSDATAADVTGMGTTLGPRDMALQGSLVRLTGATLQDPPTTANHNVMLVSTGTGATPTMAVSVTKYSGVGCQRTLLAAMTPGTSLGDVTGLLQFSFGQWILQPRTPSDFPTVVCATDGGVGDAGGGDAGTSSDAATD
jgi:hypothetical protein